MRNKSGYIIALAAAVAVFVVLFVTLSVRQTQAKEEAVQKVTQQTTVEQEHTIAAQQQDVEMVVAAQDIPKGTVVTLEMVKVIEVSRENASSMNALSVPQMAVGRTAKRNIMEDQPVMNSYLSDINETDEEKPKSLSYRIPAGMYALAITTDTLNNVAGYITEGDIVDIIADKKAVDTALGKSVVQAILEDDVNNVTETDDQKAYLVSNVPVIATQINSVQEATETVSTVVNEDGTEENLEFTQETGTAPAGDYMVLAFTKEAARLVAYARDASTLTLTLHRREEEENINLEVPNDSYSLIGDGTVAEQVVEQPAATDITNGTGVSGDVGAQYAS